MRIVAGRLGGRRLKSPPADVRPTSDRVREALFSTLGPIEGLTVLDLFAGSGALSIEALSRGATSAVLVEGDRRTAALVQENLDELGIGDEARLVRGDALREAGKLAAAGESFDLVFLDAPYADAESLLVSLAPALGELCAPGARVVVETDRHCDPLVNLPMVHERRYGDTVIRIHQASE